jgi:hypothetical protein
MKKNKIKNPPIDQKAIPNPQSATTSMNIGADINGFACITLSENGTSIRFTLDNKQAQELANSLVGIAMQNGNEGKNLG